MEMASWASQSVDDFKELSNDELLRVLETSLKGLSDSEARQRFLAVGPNQLKEKRHIGPLVLFVAKLKNPILITLLIAASISAFFGSFFSSIIIVLMVLTSAVIDFVNTYKSEKAVEMLIEKVKITTAITRDGESFERNVHEMVPGDIFTLAAGDFVPADSFVLQSKDCFLNESALTGESLPKEKHPNNPEDRILYTGTSVVTGWCIAVSAVTGRKTRLGQIAGKLETPETPTEFDKNLKSFSFFIFATTLVLVGLIIIVNIFFGRKNPLETLLFAVAIAVGLAPEMLPMIVTANLAKGALKMSKGGVIVKKLSAIHNLGSIDVLCTDKTGTLTEDRIALIKCVDGEGKDSEDVLFWGYASSVHLAGVRGTLDMAIQHFKKLDISGWEKVDEIPFDYERKRDTVVLADHTAPFSKGNHKVSAKTAVMIAKGAPEEVLEVSSYYGKSSVKLSAAHRKKIEAEYERLSSEGFRVLGLATKKVLHKTTPYLKKDEKEMTFLGFLAFLDPPKKTTKETLKKMAEHNIEIKIITGDNHLVTQRIAKELELPIKGVLTGVEIEKLTEAELREKVNTTNLFSRVSPEQKEAILQALRANGHVVGYLGDGVNDLLSLREADVGISVNNAVDIAKDTADIILLRKGLDEIIDGVMEGRKTFANIFKYLMMSLSSNFGNMMSMPIGSIFLPFLPMTAPQILLNNFLYDTSQLAIPFDHVDREFLKKPKKFDMRFIRKCMLVFGPVSTLFDFATFIVLYFGFGFLGAQFQTGWFLESIATQTLVVGIIRTRKFPWQSKPHALLVASSLGVVAVAGIIAFVPFGGLFGFTHLPLYTMFVLAGIVAVYLFMMELVKQWFYRRWGALIEK